MRCDVPRMRFASSRCQKSWRVRSRLGPVINDEYRALGELTNRQKFSAWRAILGDMSVADK